MRSSATSCEWHTSSQFDLAATGCNEFVAGWCWGNFYVHVDRNGSGMDVETKMAMNMDSANGSKPFNYVYLKV